MSKPLPTDPFGALAPAPGVAAREGEDPGAPPQQPGSASDRLATLAREGQAAQAELQGWLAKARARARWLLGAQVGAALAAALVAALLASAGVAARFGPLPGRVLLAALAAASPVALALALRRGLSVRAAFGRDRSALGRLLIVQSAQSGSAGSELLSSIELQGELHGATQGEPAALPAAPGAAARTSANSGAPFSGALISLLHQRAARASRAIDLREALPARSVRPSALGLVLALAAGAGFALAAPQTLRLGALRLWLGEAAMPLPDPEPIAGDLSITYLFPAYTNLPARVEEGTPGDLRGPKGTEVKLSARADRDLVQAFAVIDGAPVRLDASGPGNRMLSGSFPLRANGHWRFRFADKKGRPVAEGPDRTIEIVADQPPQATISDPHKTEVEVDPLGQLPLSWSAQDDYGLGKVALVWQRAGEPEQRIELAAGDASSVARRLSGTYAWDMAKLELREGDAVSFRVEAVDLDAIDGPQKGSSAIHSLKVFSEAEHHKEGLARAQALWERLVVLTADRIEERAPGAPAPQLASNPDGAAKSASKSAPNDWFSEMQSRDSRAMQLVVELQKAGGELAKDKLAPRALGRALKYVASGISPLVQRTMIARAPFARSMPGSAGAQKQLARALEGEVREEEKDVLYLDDLLDHARIDDVQELQRELKKSREELKRLAEKLRSAPDEATKKQILAEVQRLRERVTELMQRMAEMAKGINDEHLNQDAAQSIDKENDVMAQLSDVQKKMQAGDVDAALSELAKLDENLEKLEKNLSKEAEEHGAQKYAEEAKELKAAAQKLSALQSREEELEKRTGRMRKELRKQAQENFEKKGGKQLAQKLADKVAQAKKQVAKIDPHVADMLGLEDTLDAAQERVADLERALQAGDYQEALEQSAKAERAAETMQARLNVEDQLRQLNQPVEVRKSLEAAAEAEMPLREVTQALRQALPDESAQMSAEQKAELQSQEAEQKQIAQGMQGVRQQMSEVGKKVPIFGPQHEQLLQEAQGAMEQAGEKLGGKEPRGAEGSEGEALDKLGKFQDAMKQLAKGGGSGGAGMPLPWGEPQGEGQNGGESGDGDEEGNGDEQNKEHVEIPDAESSRGPQEFRKKLLDAMKQPAPASFKDKVRGYYEELVK